MLLNTSPVAVEGERPPYLWDGIGAMGSRSPGFSARGGTVVLVVIGQEEERMEQSMLGFMYKGLARVVSGNKRVSRA